LFVFNRLSGGHTGPPPAAPEDELPGVTLLIAAFNEAACILPKLENSLALDYPADKCSLLVVADGSTDATVALVERFARSHPCVAVIFEAERRGKTAAVNRAMTFVQSPIVALTDANTMLNPEALRRLVAWFGDPTIGGVSGEKRVLATDQASGAGESLYWRYESFLKRMDAQFHTLVGTAGELFALRTALFTPLALVVVLLSNLWLAVAHPGSLYPWLLAGQLLFYGLAALGWFFAERGIRWRPAFVPFYFTMMNVTALLGLVRWLRGRQTPLWEKIARRPQAPL
jgi:glycosyltransferase involved in cell wall biosynthesis